MLQFSFKTLIALLFMVAFNAVAAPKQQEPIVEPVAKKQYEQMVAEEKKAAKDRRARKEARMSKFKNLDSFTFR